MYFADFDRTRHSGVLLDGVGDAYILQKNREALQGRAKLCKGGQSATNMYSYTYSLVKRGIVATFDLSAKNLSAFERGHWLSNRNNVILLHLTEKAYEEQPAAAPSAPDAAPPPTPERGVGTKRRWVSGSPLREAPPLPRFPA